MEIQRAVRVNIAAPATSSKRFSPKLTYIHSSSKITVKFEGSYLKRGQECFTHRNVVNFFNVCELDTWSRDLNAYFTLQYYLFGAVELTKNPDPDKYSYSRYGIGFDTRSFILIVDFDWGKNVILFGVNYSLSSQTDKKYIFQFLLKDRLMDYMILQ